MKRPKEGDFRVQPNLGGSTEPSDAPEGAIELAKAALAAAPAAATYARVDILRGADGAFQVMEMEPIEPALFLDGNAQAEAAFADAVMRAVD